MRKRRGKMPDKNLTSGPGKLCIAFGIDRSLNGEHLSGDKIWVEDYKNFSKKEILEGKRIGINYAEEFAEMPWRFWVKGNPYVSKTPKAKE
jgi:DNA-3-methyladenine glycosylase